MRKRDASDVLLSAMAVFMDALAVFGGFMLAAWIRFSSGWMTIPKGRPDDLYVLYGYGAAVVTLLFLFVFQAHRLMVRPQIGSFVNKIPRLIKAVSTGTLLTAVLGFALQNEVDFSRAVIALAFFCVLFFVLLERYIGYRIEWNLARHSRTFTRVLVVGVDAVAAHVKRVLKREAMLRSRVIGFMRTDNSEPDPDIPPDQICGSVDDLAAFLQKETVNQIILTGSSLGHKRIIELILLCEKNLIRFNMVPDLFNIMTASMDVQSLDDIPLLGIGRWPLDHFWNRVLKRAEDVAGSVVGLILALPAMAAAAILIKLTSPGPVCFRQERCGERGRVFTLYKLRTMRVDAERHTGPVFATENDPRTTRVGAFLRRHNLDELPQLLNVLKGDMSLVGPRPERPHFVQKFKEDICHYMWRHVSKPGLTGWAQVNGLRGSTSIEERIKYDLYYLEHWSLAMDFKILVRTFFARTNAY